MRWWERITCPLETCRASALEAVCILWGGSAGGQAEGILHCLWSGEGCRKTTQKVTGAPARWDAAGEREPCSWRADLGSASGYVSRPFRLSEILQKP